MAKGINIVINNSGEYEGIQNDNGFGLKIGKTEKKGNYLYIRITSEDIENVNEGAQS